MPSIMIETQTEKNLKDELYYSDVYDRHTVERCRHIEGLCKDEPMIYKDKKLDKKSADAMRRMLTELHLYFEEGERYLGKKDTIQKWMDRDRAKDELYESAQPMENVTCLTCRAAMRVVHKDLYSRGLNEEDKVLFMYECPRGHLPMRAFFHDGEEWIPKRDKCPRCTAELKVELKDTKTKFISTFTCPKCGYRKVDEMKRMSAEREKEDKDFEKDRARFCLTDEEGKKYLDEKWNLEQMGKLVEEWKERDKNKGLYDEAAKIKKLTIVQLEKLLKPILGKAKYINLKFAQPEMQKDVRVAFSVQDADEARKEYDSEMWLKKLIEKSLADSNWKLMSDGIGYRLGILMGRLRGLESEEDLLELVKYRKKPSKSGK